MKRRERSSTEGVASDEALSACVRDVGDGQSTNQADAMRRRGTMDPSRIVRLACAYLLAQQMPRCVGAKLIVDELGVSRWARAPDEETTEVNLCEETASLTGSALSEKYSATVISTGVKVVLVRP